MARVVEKTARGRRTCGTCGLARDDAAHQSRYGDGHEFEARYVCGKCGERIEIGATYREVRSKRQRGGVTMRRCSTCPTWKPSELTTSEFLSILLAASEDEPEISIDPDDQDGTVSGLESLREHYAEAARSAAQIRLDAADAMEDGLGHETQTSADLRAVGDEVDGIADEIEGVDLDDFEGEPDEFELFRSWAEDKADEIRELFSTAEGA
jgi:hypothetical protein